MAVNQVSSTSIWPSRKLWIKLFFSSIYIPLSIFGGLTLLARWVVAGVVLGGLGMGEADRGLAGTGIILLVMVLFFGGPILLGISISSTFWRGILAGILSLMSMFLVWVLVVGHIFGREFISEGFGFSFLAASGVITLRLVSKDINDQRGLIGTGIGIAIGTLLSLTYAYSFLSKYDDVNELFLVGWSSYFPFVWPSAFFFPEWFSKKVGWGGFIVWMVLVAAVFGVSFVLMK